MAMPDIGAILNSLSPDDMEKLKQTASVLLGNANTQGGESPQKNNSQSELSSQTSDGLSLAMPDMAMLNSIAPVLSAFSAKDERVEFINALKPLLSEGRRQKADEASRLIRLLSVLPLLKERGLM